MKVTYSWLKDFIKIGVPPHVLAGKLTMAGLEVTSLEQRNGDFIFEIEVTSNRPDCLCVIGIAREVAAITNAQLNIPAPQAKIRKNLNKNGLKISIENKKDCPLYSAKIIRNVKVGPSPDWLKQRLESVGCRSINNVVDITNYILFTWGEPLHAFDLDRLSHPTSIFIRRAANTEKITTIDAINRGLSSDILVIASGPDLESSKPVAVAGVMGSEDTEVTKGTHNILLEAAAFNPILIRQGRQKLGVQSESSYRFERGIDSSVIEKASSEAVRLILDICGGDLSAAKSQGARTLRSKNIVLGAKEAEKILGIAIKPQQTKTILGNLGFAVKLSPKNNLNVKVPSHRLDIEGGIDLIEEVARIFGYEKVPPTIAPVVPQTGPGKSRDFILWSKNILTGLGLNEVITYSLLDQEALKTFSSVAKEPVGILNPLSQEQGILRTTLIPSLASCVAYNLNQRQEYINIFEIAKVYSLVDGKPCEQVALGMALCGTKYIWSDQGRLKEVAGFLHQKGIVENFLGRLGVQGYSIGKGHKDCQFEVRLDNDEIGLITQLNKATLEKLGIKNKEVFLAEVYLDKVAAYIRLGKKFSPLPIYPGMNRDISIVIKDNISIGSIEDAIKKEGGDLLEEAEAIDCYRGRQIPLGFKSLTLSILYRSNERTLTEDEINPLHGRILDLLVKEFNAQIR